MKTKCSKIKQERVQAFNYTEIAVMVFLVIAIFVMLIGKVFGIRQESNIIYDWKEALISSQYAYKVTVLTQKPKLDVAKKKQGTERNIEILKLLRSTFNTQGQVPVVSAEFLKNYKYRFLNGKRIPDDSIYHVTEFVNSPNGNIIVGLNWMREDCDNTDEPCGVLLLDMNGKKPPNRFGLDVFGVNIFKDELLPFGYGKTYDENQQNCQRLETGVTCSQFYLMGGQFFK